MSKLRHIYRSNKLSNIPQKRYARKYSREYLEEKAARGASIKLGFGDFDGDGDLDGLYPKQRAGVAEKPGLYVNRPRGILRKLKSEFLKDPPQFGPTGLSTGIESSSTGPAMLNASVVAPAAGPQSIEAAEITEGTGGTASAVFRMTYEKGEEGEYLRTGLLDLDINEGVLQIAGTTEIGRVAFDASLAERRSAGVESSNSVALSGDGSTYAEITTVHDSGGAEYVVNIYNKAGGSLQLQSSVYLNDYAQGIWLNEDGTSFITSGRFDQWSDGSDETSFRRYEFIGEEWVIIGPETGSGYMGQRELVIEATHITSDFKYITRVFHYSHLGANSLPMDERFFGVVVHKWDEEKTIYETHNSSYETLRSDWEQNVVKFYGFDSRQIYESFYDAVNDELRIIFRQSGNLNIRVATYTAETKTFETANSGEKQATIWGNDTPLAERTGENSATHTQIIANTQNVHIELTRDGNYLAIVSKAEGYQLFKWNPETSEYDVYASLAWDSIPKPATILRDRFFRIVDRNNFIIMGTDWITATLHHYRVNESNILEYAGGVPLGTYTNVNNCRAAVSS